MAQSSLETSKQTQAIIERLKSQEWRLNNLYRIKDADGNSIQFAMNWTQADFYKSLWFFNAILKARQLGFTTFILLYMLDSCLFEPNTSAGVIAHTREDAEDLFRNKVKFAYDSLPEQVKGMIPAVQNSARRLEFCNGSSITVGTSLRSGTYQKLLVSEYGKIAARYPDKAREIKTGALNTVHIGQQIFVESTAEGNSGEFFELCERARKLKEEGHELTRLDPRLHFYPWYRNPAYILSDREVDNTVVDSRMAEYLSSMPFLTPHQKAWYVKKAEQMGDDIKREFPSFPSEAFEQSMEGAYYTKQMSQIRKAGQIRPIQWEPSRPVHTFWDLGNRDYMAIWFMQHIGQQYRFINYFYTCDADFGTIANKLNSLGYVYGKHYFPHDGARRQQTPQGLLTQKEVANSFGIAPIEIVSRIPTVNQGIQQVKTVLPRCHFDAVNCREGIACLDNYRKKWNEKLAQWADEPLHDDASHGADAFRTFVEGFQERKTEFVDYSTRPAYVDNNYDPFSI